MSLQAYCSEFNLPDLSPLIDPSPSDHAAVVWEVLCAKVSVDERREFLRQFCSISPNPALKMLSALIVGDITEDQCNQTMGLIRVVDAVGEELGLALRNFCVQKEHDHIVSLFQVRSLDLLVFSMGDIFPAAGNERKRARYRRARGRL